MGIKARSTRRLVTVLLAGFLILRPFLTTPHSHFLSSRDFISYNSNTIEGSLHCLRSLDLNSLGKMEKSSDDKWVVLRNASGRVCIYAVAFSLTRSSTESFISRLYPILRI